MDDPSGCAVPPFDPLSLSTPRRLKRISGVPASSRGRRKKPDDTSTIHLPMTFTIEPDSEFGETVNIKTIELLPRKSINLDWIDSKTSARLFNAEIPSLNAEEVVLIVKYDNNGHKLAAVERVGLPGSGIYALFRLSSHVKMKEVRSMAVSLKRELAKWWKPIELDDVKDGASQSESEEWWADFSLDQKFLVDALSGVHVVPRSRQLSLDKLLVATKSMTVAKTKSTSKPKVAPTPSGLVLPTDADSTPELGLARLRQQYYSLLYTSKSSLQYFPKTSLSRARVIFPTNGEPPASRLDLLLCLENMVVSVDECDEKYRTGIREVSNARRAQGGATDQMTNDQFESAIVPPKCLRDNEIKYVLKWLGSLSDDDGPVRSLEQEDIHIQKCITELRSRETELQIIVILEILAIKQGLSEEKMKEYEKMKKAADRRKRRREKAEQGVANDKKKRRKKMDLMVLLDLHIDRLCIWHSIGSGDEPKRSQPKQKDAKDRLKHFCIEIVTAYYSSRLPSICEDIRCKCTGKIKQARKDQEQTGGDETQLGISQIETQDAMPDTTEDSSLFSKSVYGGRPVLSRSLTAPVGRPQLERAESSFSVSLQGDSQDFNFDFAAQVSQDKEVMKTSFRGGITNTKKNAERRVVEMANPRAKRRKTEGEDESQLKDAIKNIAKPNRLAVAEEMVSASAQRMKITGRKPKKTIRIPVTSNNVQVAATPRKNTRTLKLLERKPDVPRAITEEDDPIPPSSQIIPQSSIRNAKRKSEERDEVEATPSKAPRIDISDHSRGAPQNDAQRLNLLQSSPLCISATPIRPKRSFMDTLKYGSSKNQNVFLSGTPNNPFRTSTTDSSLAKGFMNSIAETPTKPSVSSKLRSSLLQIDEADVITSSPLAKPKPGTPVNRRLVARNLEDDFGNDDTDIYKSLGWNDY